MKKRYTSEKNILQLIALLKAHGVKKVVASPGNTNISFIGSIQNDADFEIYSCVDERSAAYMACGLSEESNEPVVISCTGATAARNYPSALTEAFYRKLPILAITSSQPFGRTGQLFPQFTDRSTQFKDIVTMSVQIPTPYTKEEYWSNNVKINSAILQLTRNGGGPVHINIETLFSRDFSVKKLPDERVIYRIYSDSERPELDTKKICIFIGSHKKINQELEEEIDKFCAKYNAMVLCDQTSNYKGKFRVLGGLIAGQDEYYASCRTADLIIHLGEISGAYYSFRDTRVWRVSKDGEVRDPLKMLTHVFQMSEMEFFKYYNDLDREPVQNTYYGEWIKELTKMERLLPELPLSNVWLCKQTASRLPKNAVLHLGILNSLRSWNLFDVPNSVYTYSNVGGFGIDGILSSCVGASLANTEKIYFCVLGDLAFFYDINVLGNRHIGNNLRILVSNNGTGYEMHCAGSLGKDFGRNEADKFFAAGGHNGSQSRDVIKNFALSLGFEYLKAETKEEYLSQLEYFISSESHDSPIIFEVFVNLEDDDFAYESTKRTVISKRNILKRYTRRILGEKFFSKIKMVLNK